LLRQDRELAKVGAESGNYPEAEQLYKQIIPMDEKEATSNQEFKVRDLAEDLMDLSRVYRHEQRYDDAVDTIKRSEMVDERAAKAKFAKPDQVSLLQWYSQNELAEIYREKGDIAAAKPLFERSLEMSKKMPLGAGHPRIAELLSNYANLLGDDGKFDEAESFYKRALDTWAKSWYPQQLEQAETLTNYAALLRKLDRPVEAEPLEARAAAIRAKVSGLNPSELTVFLFTVRRTIECLSSVSALPSYACPTGGCLSQENGTKVRPTGRSFRVIVKWSRLFYDVRDNGSHERTSASLHRGGKPYARLHQQISQG
jgi:hypothetical protein